MPWTPTYTTIKSRLVAANVLTYITNASRQADAYTWAGATGLKVIKTISNSVASRTTPVYPAIAFSDDNEAQTFEDDITIAAYSFIFEVSVQNSSPTTAVTNAGYYRDALVSMIRNCPLSTLAANTGADEASTVIDSIEVGFEPIKTNAQQNDFLQVFQIRTTCRLQKSAYT